MLIDLTAFYQELPLPGIEDPSTQKVEMWNLGILSRDCYALKDNLRLDNEELAIKELMFYKNAGGHTVVDASLPGIGRNPEGLRRISEKTGLMGTGFYVGETHLKKLDSMTEDEIGDLMVKELVEGIDGIYAGYIGEIGISEIFDDKERRVLRAAAIAHKKTGAAISRPRNKKIEKGDMTFLQIGARVDGYASSIGRTVVFGKATPEQKELIEVGYKAQADVISKIKAGVPASDIAKFHVKNVTDMGYGDWLLYGPCHGNGTMEGEAPWIETNSVYLLEENMTFCVDIFLGSKEKEIGLRMEDVICVTKDGVENLTNYPRELFEIE